MALENEVGEHPFTPPMMLLMNRTGGLQLAMMVDANVVVQEEDVLFATSTFNLTEFLALRPQFAKARKVFLS